MLTNYILHRVQQLSRMREILDHFEDPDFVERWMDETGLYEMFDPDDSWIYWRAASDDDCFEEALQLFIRSARIAIKRGIQYHAASYEYWYVPCADPENPVLAFGTHDPQMAQALGRMNDYSWIAVCLDNKAHPGIIEYVPRDEWEERLK